MFKYLPFILIFFISDLSANTIQYWNGLQPPCNAQYLRTLSDYATCHANLAGFSVHTLHPAPDNMSGGYYVNTYQAADGSWGLPSWFGAQVLTIPDPCIPKAGAVVTSTWVGGYSQAPQAIDSCLVLMSSDVSMCMGIAPDQQCVGDFTHLGRSPDSPVIQEQKLVKPDPLPDQQSFKSPSLSTENNLPPESICDAQNNCTVVDVNEKSTQTGTIGTITYDENGVTHSVTTGYDQNTRTTTTTTTLSDGSLNKTTTIDTTVLTGGTTNIRSTYSGNGSTRTDLEPSSNNYRQTINESYDPNGNLLSKTTEGDLPSENTDEEKYNIGLPAGPQSWYTSQYPDGVTQIYLNFMDSIKTGSIGTWLNSWSLPSSGVFPALDFNFNIPGIGNFGSQGITISNEVISAARVFILLTAMFVAFRLIFGGA